MELKQVGIKLSAGQNYSDYANTLPQVRIYSIRPPCVQWEVIPACSYIGSEWGIDLTFSHVNGRIRVLFLHIFPPEERNVLHYTLHYRRLLHRNSKLKFLRRRMPEKYLY